MNVGEDLGVECGVHRRKIAIRLIENLSSSLWRRCPPVVVIPRISLPDTVF